MKPISNFAAQNWLITPAAVAVGQHPPANISEQQWLLVLSGVVTADLKGTGGTWLNETLSFVPDMAGPDNSGPLNWAISHFNIPKPTAPPQSYSIGFSLQEWAPFASLGSIFNQDNSVNSGFAVNGWRPAPFAFGTDVASNVAVNQIFTGIYVDVAVSDVDAWIYKVAYNITLLGRIVFPRVPVIF
jgi:hypothetical protein